MLGSCMPRFIEVGQLEICQKSGIYGWKEKERNKASLTQFGKIQSAIKFEVTRISTRSKRHSSRYPLLGT